MRDGTRQTVVVAFAADLGIALSKTAAAIITGSAAMAAEASHSLADVLNGVFLLIAQQQGTRDRDDRHPLGFGRSVLLGAAGGDGRVHRRRCVLLAGRHP
jgi:divalent metal cation (Fe/Co/Zn/Cd) transporter